MTLFSKYEYLKTDRLSDVIRLISVLGIEDRYSFRKNDGLNTTLNGPPKSGKDWFEVAKNHPEFFKFGVNGDTVVLLLRFLNRIGEQSQEKYPPLTIDQTQKLIDQTIILHDKQLARLQKNSFLIPILTAVIASITTGLVAYFTLTSNDQSIKNIENKLDTVIKMIDKPTSKTNSMSISIDSLKTKSTPK